MRKITLLTALFGTLAACTTVGNGDYVVYRVALGDTNSSSDCFGEDGEDIETRNDESSFLPSQSFALYRVVDTYYMDFGEFVITGTKTGSQFDFSGDNVDRSYFGADDENEETDTDEINVTFTVSGASISGTYETVTSFTCDGPDCSEGSDFTCTGSSPFFGSEVRDVDLEWNIDR